MRHANWGSALLYKGYTFDKTADQIGEGTYGAVYRAQHVKTGDKVAIKSIKICQKSDGVPLNALREIKLLKLMSHRNIVKLRDIVCNNPLEEATGIHLIFEYMDHDMTGLMHAVKEGQKGLLTVRHKQSYAKQLMLALAYLHKEKNIIHRDLKSSNLLLSSRNVLKLADFGLARMVDRRQSTKLTTNVVTLWYRPPELLLGAVHYDTAIDIWSAGCIIGEFLSGTALFPASTEIKMVDKIFSVCGSPETVGENRRRTWPEHEELSKYKLYEHLCRKRPRRLQPYLRSLHRKIFTDTSVHVLPTTGCAVVDTMLSLNPATRPSAVQILREKFLSNAPEPHELPPLTLSEGYHEFQTKQARRKARLQRQKQREQERLSSAQARAARSTATATQQPDYLASQTLAAAQPADDYERQRATAWRSTATVAATEVRSHAVFRRDDHPTTVGWSNQLMLEKMLGPVDHPVPLDIPSHHAINRQSSRDFSYHDARRPESYRRIDPRDSHRPRQSSSDSSRRYDHYRHDRRSASMRPRNRYHDSSRSRNSSQRENKRGHSGSSSSSNRSSNDDSPRKRRKLPSHSLHRDHSYE